MRAYKYVTPADAASAMAGTFFIGTPQYYQGFEDPLRDDLDSSAARELNDVYITDTSKDVEETALMASIGIMLKGCTNVTATRNKQITTASGYLLCLSAEPHNAHLLGTGKSTVIEIDDVTLLAHRLRMAFPNKLGEAIVKRVSYQEVVADARKVASVTADPFIKRPIYEHEQEVRIFWPPLDPPAQFLAPCPRAAGLLRLV